MLFSFSYSFSHLLHFIGCTSKRMRLFLLVVVVTTINPNVYCLSTPTKKPVNCYWLGIAWHDVYYNCECCNLRSVIYLNTTYGASWITSSWARTTYFNRLHDEGLCDGMLEIFVRNIYRVILYYYFLEKFWPSQYFLYLLGKIMESD